MQYIDEIDAVWSFSVFREGWKTVLDNAIPTIKSLAHQFERSNGRFMVDVAHDRSVAEKRLLKEFQTHAPNIIGAKRLAFTPLTCPQDGAPIDNNEVASQRLGKYIVEGYKGPADYLFCGDFDDVFGFKDDRHDNNYVGEMIAALHRADAIVAIANQVAFPMGKDWQDGTPIQSPRMEQGHIFDLKQILDFNIAGLCNTVFNLNKLPKDSHLIFKQATNKQLDRAFIAYLFALGEHGVLSKANMGYGQGSGIYGANQTPLKSEKNMQVKLTALLMQPEIFALFPEKAQKIITHRYHQDLAIETIWNEDPKAYQRLSAEHVQPIVDAGLIPFWGEAVVPVPESPVSEPKVLQTVIVKDIQLFKPW